MSNCLQPPISTDKPHLPGPAATRQWFLAAERGDVGLLEKQVSRMRELHSRMELHKNHPHFTGGKVHNFPTDITLEQVISDLINMQQPWTKVVDNDDPYLDEYDGGSSAMLIAAARGHTEIVSFFLSLGCQDLGLTDAQGMNALHHACVQGNADILKMLLLACPSSSIQVALLNARDKRAMDCRKLVSVGKSEWQSSGKSAHSSGSFLRRKAYQTLLLPTIRWWKNRKDRRNKTRRLGNGISGDKAGSRNFDLTQSLVAFPPAPQCNRLSSGSIGKKSLVSLVLASRRTRSPLATLSNEHIWLTAMEYDDEEELELGSAVAHSSILKKSLETIDTVIKAKQLLIVLRFALNMKKGRLASSNRCADSRLELLINTRDGQINLDKDGKRISWHNQDNRSKQNQEIKWMTEEDKKSTKIRSYLTVDTIKLSQLKQLYHQLAGEEIHSMKTMSSLKFSRFASLVGEFANEEHVATILTSMPSFMRNENFVGDCSFINFVEFWLHAETLEMGGGNSTSFTDDDNMSLTDMIQQLNEQNLINNDKVDWFNRLRTRMRIDRTLNLPQNGDPTNIVLRKSLLGSIPMGVGVVPNSFYNRNRIVSHRKPRPSLISFKPAKEFTQEEVIRQRRARKSNIGNEPVYGDAPELPDHLKRDDKSTNIRAYDEGDHNENEGVDDRVDEENEEDEEDEETKKQRKKDEAAAKRLADAKEAAFKLEAKQKALKEKRDAKKKQQEDEAKLEAQLFIRKQKKEKIRLKKIEKRKKQEAARKKREEKKVLKEKKKDAQKLMRSAKKNNAKIKKTTKLGRRVVDNGVNYKKGRRGKGKEKEEIEKEKEKEKEEKEKEFKFVLIQETPSQKRCRLEKMKREAGEARKNVDDTYHEQSLNANHNWSTLRKSYIANQVNEKKEKMKKDIRKARKRALRRLNCEDEEWNIYDSDTSSNETDETLLKAPQDDASILARQRASRKTFDIENIFGTSDEIEIKESGWNISDDFEKSGYAHKKHLKLIKLTPLLFIRKKKKI